MKAFSAISAQPRERRLDIADDRGKLCFRSETVIDKQKGITILLDEGTHLREDVIIGRQ